MRRVRRNRVPGILALVLAAQALATVPAFGAQSVFDPDRNVWTIGNGWLQAVLGLTPDGYFLIQSLADLQSGDVWTASPNRPASPIDIETDSDPFNAQRPFQLVDQYTRKIDPNGLRQYIVLQDSTGAAQITVILDIYENQPVLRVLDASGTEAEVYSGAGGRQCGWVALRDSATRGLFASSACFPTRWTQGHQAEETAAVQW